jgi:hypothetical protein
MRSTIAIALFGAALGLLAPPAVLLSASQELIGFISLLLAGLVPAMTLTATALRGEGLSSARVRDYGKSLRRQLDFWGVLFLVGLVAVFAICAAKIVSKSDIPEFNVSGRGFDVSTGPFASALLMIGFSALSVIVARLWPAYRGLRSLLDLTVGLAERQALANDRTLGDELEEKRARVANDRTAIPVVGWTVEGPEARP